MKNEERWLMIPQNMRRKIFRAWLQVWRAKMVVSGGEQKKMVVSGGEREWLSVVASKNGCQWWRARMVVSCGENWLSVVASENGCQLWRAKMVVSCGEQKWLSVMASENGCQWWRTRMTVSGGEREWFAMVARKLFSSPVTSCSSERNFSTIDEFTKSKTIAKTCWCDYAHSRKFVPKILTVYLPDITSK